MRYQLTLSKREQASAFIVGIAAGLVVLLILGFILYQVPFVKLRAAWRIDFATTYLKGLIDPVQAIPTAASDGPVEWIAFLESTPVEAPSPASDETPLPPAQTATPTSSPMPIPGSMHLDSPAYELQELNNCGPATLAMYLRHYGWQGDQSTISRLVKPKKEDRNVNVEELVAYVNTQVPGLDIQYRVGGDIATLKRFLAAGFPVMIEESFYIEETYWPNDDRWAGHYLLLTGYNDQLQEFTAQDSFIGPDLQISYSILNERWKSFNRVYMIVYQPDQLNIVQSLFGEHWNADYNRRMALEAAQYEVDRDLNDAFAWFNIGTNYVYFKNYGQAAAAYDKARNAGLPQRMLRYQFGPFFAYFNTNRFDDLLVVTEYALKRTPNSEEALLWRGWVIYRLGNKEEALKLFEAAYAANPQHPDAKYAIGFILSQ